MTRAADVVVVGAGLAGLSAAVALARAGATALVLEARGRLGGRATAFLERETGEVVDNGQHVMLGCYHETFRFLESIGARTHVQLQEALCVPFVDADGRASVLECPRLPSPFHLLAGVLRWNALPIRDRLAVLRLVPVLARARAWAAGRAVDADRLAQPAETVEQWLVRHGQPPALREMLWEPLALAALNQDVRHASALPFVRVLGGVFGPDPGDAAIALPIVPLDEMYATPARQELERLGSKVRVNALARIVVEGGRVTAVEIRGEPLRAATVVAAVPWHGLPGLFRGDTAPLAGVLSNAASTGPSPIVTVNLWFDRPVLAHPFVGLPGRVMQWVFDKRALVGGASHLSLVSSGAADVVRQSNDALATLALREVHEALPEARAARLVRSAVVREAQATFSLAPGQPPRPQTRTRVEGLYLAGDWVDTGLPATIEGAVVSGHRAAGAVLADLSGRRARTL